MPHHDFIHVDHSHFFVGDTHLGHAGILDLAMRPYRDIAEHDRDVVAGWNSVVKPTDTVWHLGDFAWDKLPVSDASALFTKLNGVKRLVIGLRGPEVRLDQHARYGHSQSRRHRSGAVSLPTS